LPCYVVREGYYNVEAFHTWLVEEFLLFCNPFSGLNSVIILDNANSHYNPIIAETIHARGCLVRYLPLYSPDFSPIELSFSVLKAWVRRRFQELWPFFQGSFGDFLLMCVIRSRCDRFAEAHYRHSGNRGYIFEGDMEKFERELRAFERGSGEGEIEF
jgi:transposase